MKSLIAFTAWILMLGPVVFPAQAAFTSLYVFGDGISTTTNGPGGIYYYGRRYSNGRVWVELLAEWQGLAYDANKNWSYYGHFSPNHPWARVRERAWSFRHRQFPRQRRHLGPSRALRNRVVSWYIPENG